MTTRQLGEPERREGACVLILATAVGFGERDRATPRPRPRPAPRRRRRRARARGRLARGQYPIPIGCSLAEAERRIILANLRHYGTRARAAEALGVGLRTLYTKLAAWSRGAEDAETA
jgi:DNA-binding NtrC family response regulator